MAQKSGIKRLIHDITDLIELQFELFAVDGKLFFSKSLVGLTCLTIASATAISSVTIGLSSLAGWLHFEHEWGVPAALLVAAALGLLITTCLLVGVFVSARSAMASVGESRTELKENVAWLKALLLRDNFPPGSSGDEEHEPHDAFNTEFYRQRESWPDRV